MPDPHVHNLIRNVARKIYHNPCITDQEILEQTTDSEIPVKIYLGDLDFIQNFLLAKKMISFGAQAGLTDAEMEEMAYQL